MTRRDTIGAPVSLGMAAGPEVFIYYRIETSDDHVRIELGELLAAINRAAAPIAPLIQGNRHVEAFEACV